MTNSSKTLYVGVTNDLLRRVCEHRKGKIKGFALKYNLKKLVYFEQTIDILSAINREKQIKAYRREKKLVLIESRNAQWKDLFFKIR